MGTGIDSKHTTGSKAPSRVDKPLMELEKKDPVSNGPVSSAFQSEELKIDDKMSCAESWSVERHKRSKESRVFGTSERTKENGYSPPSRVSEHAGPVPTKERLQEEIEKPAMHKDLHAYSNLTKGYNEAAEEPVVEKESKNQVKDENLGNIIKQYEEPEEELEEYEVKSQEGEEVEYEEDFVE